MAVKSIEVNLKFWQYEQAIKSMHYFFLFIIIWNHRKEGQWGERTSSNKWQNRG